MKYGIIKTGSAFLYETADAVRGWQSEGGCADEAFLGWTARILQERGHSYYVRMFYGYEGYLPKEALMPCKRKDLKKRYKGQSTWIVTAPALDVLAQPKVQGRILVRVPRGGFLTEISAGNKEADKKADKEREQKTLQDDKNDRGDKIREAGYIHVLLPDGRRGYVSTAHIKPAPDFPSLTFPKHAQSDAQQAADREEKIKTETKTETKTQTCAGECKTDEKIILEAHEKKADIESDEEVLREKIVQTAKSYLGTQYCWGGKSPAGTDCSGLAFMSYFMNGILIYRDAQIQEGYPIHEIPYEKVKKGDLLFFPGHVAVSLGEDRFVHSTGRAGDFGVVYGSFLENDEGYRPDLEASLQHCGSLFY